MQVLPLFISICIIYLLSSCSDMKTLFEDNESQINFYCGSLSDEIGKKDVLVKWKASRDTQMHKKGAKYKLYYSENNITEANLVTSQTIIIDDKCLIPSSDGSYNLA